MVKGYVVNNTGRSRHIFKRMVYPGQRVDLEYVYKVLGKNIPEDNDAVTWLEQYLPTGWELNIVSEEEAAAVGGRMFKETLTAEIEVAEEDHQESYEYATTRKIDKMTARDIYNLRLKDNPKRVIDNINSIHKLRRALTLCKGDSRKNMLTRLIQRRIRELNITL